MTEAPKTIQKDVLLQPDGAGLQAYANSLCSKMSAIHRTMAPKIEGFKFKRTGVTSDDISAEVVPFLNAVKTVLDVQDQPRRLDVAYQLIISLQEDYSYANPGASYGDRPSDTLSDTMLVEVASERRQKGEVWSYAKDLESIEESSSMLEEYGTSTYFPEAIALFKLWKEEDEAGSNNAK